MPCVYCELSARMRTFTWHLSSGTVSAQFAAHCPEFRSHGMKHSWMGRGTKSCTNFGNTVLPWFFTSGLLDSGILHAFDFSTDHILFLIFPQIENKKHFGIWFLTRQNVFFLKIHLTFVYLCVPMTSVLFFLGMRGLEKLLLVSLCLGAYVSMCVNRDVV